MDMNPEVMNQLIAEYFKNKGLPLSPAVTFGDVIIKERISDIVSRKDITDLRAWLSRDFYLNIPIVSSNMDTVTDSRMAIALARLGGMGFIHQFFPLEQRVDEVKKVKRADNTVIENPATINPKATLAEAKKIMDQYQISCLLVVNQHGKLVGILTSRDMRFKTNLSEEVWESMTSHPLVTASKNVTAKEAEIILQKKKVEKLPLIDKDGRVTGLITAKDILKRGQFPNAARDKRGQLVVGATLRFKGGNLLEAETLLNAGADVLLLDTARGSAWIVAEKVGRIKKKFPKSVLVVGNTANPDAVVLFARMGADCVKIGIGPGKGCKTQEVAGVGCPQLHAIAECAVIAKKLGMWVIGDGGISKGNHLVKAIVAGADAVMIGGLLSGTDESPGFIKINKKGQLVKIFRGSASTEHQMDRVAKGDLDSVREGEGESGEVPYVGSLTSVINGLLGGLRSGMSYVGVRNLKDMWRFGRFRWRSKEAIEEGKPRI